MSETPAPAGLPSNPEATSAAETLYLVDVYSLMFQVFHAIPEMTGSRGQPTNAVFGITRDIFNIIQKKKPSHLICAVDLPGKVTREEMYTEYKANRAPMPESLAPQIPMIMELIEAFGVPLIGHEGWEADDVIATVVEQASSRNMDVSVVSNDKDIRQLLSPRVKLYHVRKELYFGEEELLADWGVRPEQVIDFQSLVGDSVDNVPGVPSIGHKTATTLLQQFGTLDAILARTDEVTAKRARENLKLHAESAILSRNLVTLNRNLPLTVNWDLARLGQYNVPRLLELFADYNFRRAADDARRLLPAPPKPSKRKGKKPAANAPSLFEVNVVAEGDLEDGGTLTVAASAIFVPLVKRALTFHVVDTPEKFALFLEQLRTKPSFCLDLETTSIDPVQADIVGWAISWEPLVGWYLPVRGPEQEAKLAPEVVMEGLRPILENPAVEIVNQNIKYDQIVLRRAGVTIAQIGLDTMVGDYLLESGARIHNLDELARRYLKHEMIPISELIGKGLFEKTMDQVEIARVAEYAAEDAEVAWDLTNLIGGKLREQGLWDLYWTLERPLIEVLAELQFNGISVNYDLLREMSGEAQGQLEIIQREIYELAGRQFNIDSPKQLQEILFKELKLPSRRRTSTGESSTGQDVLEQLAKLHALPAKIVEHRKLSKLKNTYLDALPLLANPVTGRIHASFNQVVAATGRLSSSDPNLQNIPIRSDDGRRIRAAFVAPPGWKLLCADYSQIELRMMAHFSGDAALSAAFANDVDIHTAVAAQINNVDQSAVTREMRRVAKAVNFGVIYGQSPYGLAMNLGIDRKLAEKFINEYFAKYSGVDAYLQKILKDCVADGFVRTIRGRRRAITGILRVTGRQRNQPEREAINTVIQGSAADLIKQAMINLYHRLRRENHPARMLLQIHDELVLETPEDRVNDLAAIVREEMANAMPLNVPLKVDVTSGSDWLNQQ